MTTKQRSELDAAIERATAAGVEVCGHGYVKATGEKLFCVPSQRDASHWHVVRLVGGHRLACDCESRVICVHRAAVHMELIVEAAHKEADAAAVARELEREAEHTSAGEYIPGNGNGNGSDDDEGLRSFAHGMEDY